MAYNNAVVNNVASLKVVNTDEALLKIVPKPANGWPQDKNDPLYFPKTNNAPIPGNKDETLFVDTDGTMHIVFGKGKGGKDFGLQPNSVYIWEFAFGVINNSKEDVWASVVVEDSLRPYVFLKQAKDNRDWKHETGYLRLNNEPGRLFSIKVDLTDFQGDLKELTGSIKVLGEAR